MSKVKSTYISFGTGTRDVNSRVIPANFTPSNYSPSQIASEGNDKISAHLNGIDLVLGSIAPIPEDISEQSWIGPANNTANQSITNFSFDPTLVRSFEALVSIAVAISGATNDLYAQYKLNGIYRTEHGDWILAKELTVGDSLTGIDFDITALGQIRVSLGNVTNFTSASTHFRALVTRV
jgi:hypothetical protein